MKPLDRKLLRDLTHLKGQILAIALIVACGIASFVSMQTSYESLELSQSTYYNQYRFADVFGQLTRPPMGWRSRSKRFRGWRRYKRGWWWM
ncbi:hypothetical protein [Egbenema bharatensis]|uniref:hypothetical protein n=1 Tax=Egbenema bharatensis TaxID=3463334 RepID=UPI003A8A9754